MQFTERGIAVRFRSVLVLGLLAGSVFAQQDYGAGDVFNKVKSKFGTKEGIKQNADIPLKTDRPMTNVAGTESFDVRVQCPSRREGIKITFLPLSGNDYRLLIREDLDRDGSYEYVYDTDSAGVRVSGVCYSGIVSCDNGGTWTNCQYYVWDAGNSGYVSLVPTDDTSLLGGCFCSNSSCGVNTLAQEIVDYVSGGVAQAVMKARNDLGVSKANFDVSTMTQNLYVQSAQGCSYGGSTIYGEASPTDVYNTQTPPDGLSYVATHPEVQNSTDSPYYLVNRASQAQYQGRSISYPSRVSCDIRKDVAVYTTDMYEDCANTWIDENGEVWCDYGTYKDRGGSHCGNRECRDCDAFLQETGGQWVVCGEATYSSCDWYYDTCDPYSYSCTTDLCNFYENFWGFGGQWLWNMNHYPWFKVGNYLRSDCSQTCDDFGCWTDCIDVYELLCIKPKEKTLTLHLAQKWAVAFEISALGGDRGGWWDVVYFADGQPEGAKPGWNGGTCGTRTWFKVLGTASEEGETHTLGGIQTAHGWGKNHEYPPRWGYIRILKSQVYKGDVISLSQTNTCPTDDRCVIKNEWICDNRGENCIQTVREGVRTGITPQPMCYQTNTQIGSYFVCAYGDRIEVRGNPDIYGQTYTGSEMWFWIKREYECPPESIDIDLTRPSAVLQDPGTGYDSSTGEFNVADYSCSNGVCTPTNNYTANLGTPDSCPVAMCTVRTTQTDTSVFADRTNRSQTPGGSQGPVLEVRSCQRDAGGSWVCPHESTETVVEACRCDQGLDSTGFTTSITVLQGVVDASKDIICSSVSP